jgi:cytochrome c oxidase assembly protein subunit 15
LGALIGRAVPPITLGRFARGRKILASSATPISAVDWHGADRAVRIWLLLVAALVLCMVVVGGATRLTDSGLSITEWQPILGAIPPLSEADWLSAFEKYKTIPEYAIVNSGMSLSQFKFIYWWEWTHRFLGRFIGFAFALPLVGLWLARMLRPGFALKLLGVLALGGLQGAIGWYMVMSGLVDRVDVSQYRLALHLLTAFGILALLVWLALDVGPPPDRMRTPTLPRSALCGARLLFVLVLLQAGLGALVAGLKAGLTYNTWPLMDGRFVPDGLGTLSPWYVNVFENITAVQFDHRMVAYAVAAVALWQVVSLARAGTDECTDERAVGSAGLLAAAVLAQIALGIWTLVHGVPLALGLAHQAGAAIVVATATLNLHVVTRATARA